MTYPGIRIEGAILSPDILGHIEDLPGQKPGDFGLDPSIKVKDEIVRCWADAQDYWRIFQRKLEPSRIQAGPKTPRSPRVKKPAGFEQARKELLVEDIVSVVGEGDGKRSRPFYQLVAQKLNEQIIMRALSETKAAALQGTIRTTRGRFFVDLVKRYAQEAGVVLNPRKEKGEPSA